MIPIAKPFLGEEEAAPARRVILSGWTAYQHQSWRSAGPLFESERAQDECILLPLYHLLTKEEQELVVSALKVAVAAECLV